MRVKAEAILDFGWADRYDGHRMQHPLADGFESAVGRVPCGYARDGGRPGTRSIELSLAVSSEEDQEVVLECHSLLEQHE